MPAQKSNSKAKAKSKPGSAKQSKAKKSASKAASTSDSTSISTAVSTSASTPPVGDSLASVKSKGSTNQKSHSLAKLVVPTETAVSTESTTLVVASTEASAEASVEASTIEQIEQDFVSITSKLSELKAFQTDIVNDLKKLQKNVQKHIKETRKKKKRVFDPNRPKRNPSGFAKPAPLSEKLCDFLDKPYGTEMARTDVTREITQYIKKENLQDQNNRRIILPDAKLQSLMNFPEDGQDEPITYFNLQKFLRVHFLKKENEQVSKTI